MTTIRSHPISTETKGYAFSEDDNAVIVAAKRAGMGCIIVGEPKVQPPGTNGTPFALLLGVAPTRDIASIMTQTFMLTASGAMFNQVVVAPLRDTELRGRQASPAQDQPEPQDQPTEAERFNAETLAQVMREAGLDTNQPPSAQA